jgi:hypothetical protein
MAGPPPESYARVRTVALRAWPVEEVARLEDPAWGAFTPHPPDSRCDLTVVVELLEEGTDRARIVASWCGAEGPLPTALGLIDAALADQHPPRSLAAWSRLRIGRVAVLRGDPFGSASARARGEEVEMEEQQQVDLRSLTGEDRAFAIALVRSDHTDDELRQALRWGRRATIFGPTTVLGEFAVGSGTLSWGAAIRAALAERKRLAHEASVAKRGGPTG